MTLPLSFLDTKITASKLKFILELGFVLLVILTGMAGGLVFWQLGILLILSIVIMLSTHYQPYHLTHLVCLTPSFKEDNLWQLGITQQQNQQIWQGKLINAYDKGIGVFLIFAIDEPIKQTLKITLYADQLPNNAWRQLKSTLRFFQPIT